MVYKTLGCYFVSHYEQEATNIWPIINHCKIMNILTHRGPETRILVFGVFSLQLWKTDDANLHFNTRMDFTHLITQYTKQKK
jgi:hypothetical protein